MGAAYLGGPIRYFVTKEAGIMLQQLRDQQIEIQPMILGVVSLGACVQKRVDRGSVHGVYSGGGGTQHL